MSQNATPGPSYEYTAHTRSRAMYIIVHISFQFGSRVLQTPHRQTDYASMQAWSKRGTATTATIKTTKILSILLLLLLFLLPFTSILSPTTCRQCRHRSKNAIFSSSFSFMSGIRLRMVCLHLKCRSAPHIIRHTSCMYIMRLSATYACARKYTFRQSRLEIMHRG